MFHNLQIETIKYIPMLHSCHIDFQLFRGKLRHSKRIKTLTKSVTLILIASVAPIR